MNYDNKELREIMDCIDDNMKKKLFDLFRYYNAKYIVEGIKEEQKTEDYTYKRKPYDYEIFLKAYQASDQRKIDSIFISFVVPFFQRFKCDKILNEEQRSILKKMFETIGLEINLKHEDSIFSKRFDFYNQIIDEYEKKSNFDFQRYYSMIGYVCFNTQKFDSNNWILEEEFLKYFGIQNEKNDKFRILIYYHQVSLQYFFIDLFEYLNKSLNISKEFIMKQYYSLNIESNHKYELEKKAIDNINCCCIINNKKRIFNYVDNLCKLTSRLKYYIDENNELQIKILKVNILTNLKSCICDQDYLSMYHRDFTYWTLKYNDRYIYFDGEHLCYCDYPAFFIRIDYDKENMLNKEHLPYYEVINIKSSIMKVFSVITPFFENIDVDLENISCEPCFEHAELYSDEKDAFELLFNSEYKKEYRIFMNEEVFLDNFKFEFFEY